MSAAEKIAELAEKLEDQVRTETIKDIIAELCEALPAGTALEEGWNDAIDFLSKNFL